MKERGIIFSGPMVRALLDGSKTQTWRAMKNPASVLGFRLWLGRQWERVDRKGHVLDMINCPYGQPGDRLWVKETWAARPDQDYLPPSQCDDTGLWWKASLNGTETGYATCHGKWRPSIFMPRWASRILLEITAVRVERLHEISEEDAWAEGCLGSDGDVTGGESGYTEYAGLWETINGAGSWDKNPWVWVLEFKRIEP
ncbi:hypothetical protein C8R31_101626 [Nitrosospira sp. Nsp2]|uniref:hypothetical protein n=1 Tax=Nitrosospira sp. Nsp2 TaxID=136548 RepID=UPI000D316EF9|nr:hypothetical protein [Nitrosospira sp. Nsp2]PTR17462.1 hypothetical protein C8R31_101626 [Nitrosospira sp. Nsp2]